jgi:septal ring factor EnvC (AmiA/AmiB activator)
MRTKTFDKCIKNEMEEDMQKEFMELRQDVVESKTDIADNKQNIADNKQNIADNEQNIADHRKEIHNINTRHIPPNIHSKLCCLLSLISIMCRGRRGRDRMVVGFTTTYAISVNHH